MEDLRESLKHWFQDPVLFVRLGSGLILRGYQREVMLRVVESVSKGLGETFVVIFPRQSGKNELQAQIEAYLLALLSQEDAEIVKVSPTWKPQSLNAMRRLERVLRNNTILQTVGWRKEHGYIYRVGRARIFFLSGGLTSNIVGATASTLLECDEAQDVTIAKWDKEIAPMAASSNATRVFWGTAWTSQTLLAREFQAARVAENLDGKRRAWRLTADEVGREVPAYAAFVNGQVSRLGRQHPFVRTQFYSEEIDAAGGLFTPGRLSLMQGTHPRRTTPEPARLYAFLIDVGGEELGYGSGMEQELGSVQDDQPATGETRSRFNQPAGNPLTQGSFFEQLGCPAVTVARDLGRDATALTIVEVDLSGLDEPPARPIYRVVQRLLWTGEAHNSLYGQLKALVELWSPRRIVIDASGVGAGLASFLKGRYGAQVIPFQFSLASKSNLGWRFLGVIETGRFKDWAGIPGRETLAGAKALDEREDFIRQCVHCQVELLAGPGKLMRWGVPAGARDPATGELLHDDLLISAALCALLDEQTWGEAKSAMVKGQDVLEGLGFEER